ncbi:hypothetical protein B4090_2198 [Bacillus licheniformis]|nr:hypothetical protein B4090_2198 [Bacillus licheniformis]TWK02065.1 hypothetical protein CHCC20442_3344 [Bacillus licheniformis]TWK69646.1 hypothetical protein CHCC20342_2364 [Bacillus licheniformis]
MEGIFFISLQKIPLLFFQKGFVILIFIVPFFAFFPVFFFLFKTIGKIQN